MVELLCHNGFVNVLPFKSKTKHLLQNDLIDLVSVVDEVVKLFQFELLDPSDRL